MIPIVNPYQKLKMNKSKEKKIKKPVEKTPAPRPTSKRKKGKSGDAVKELFGVHIISDRDIENHFGTPEQKPSAEARKEDASLNEAETTK